MYQAFLIALYHKNLYQTPTQKSSPTPSPQATSPPSYSFTRFSSGIGTGRVNLTDTSSHISIDSLELHLTPKILFIFFLKAALYLTMVGEKFESYGVQITGKGICKFKKLKTDIFTYSRQAELSPRFLLSLTFRQREVSHSRKSVSPVESVEETHARTTLEDFGRFCN